VLREAPNFSVARRESFMKKNQEQKKNDPRAEIRE
jgi:hypothetical protein